MTSVVKTGAISKHGAEPTGDELYELYKAGDSLRVVAQKVGMSAGTVRNRLIAAGYKLRPPRTPGVEGIDGHEIYALYETGMPMSDVAKRVGTSTSTARLRMMAAGYELRGARRDVDSQELYSLYQTGMTLAAIAQRFEMSVAGVRKRLICAGYQLRGRSELRQARAKGYTDRQYRTLTTGPDKHRPLHRVLMERRLGRRLTRDEVVHHVDHDKYNNAISNLQVMSISEHARHHRADESLKRWGFNLDAHKHEIVRLYEKGHSSKAISVMFSSAFATSISSKAIHSRLRRWGVEIRTPLAGANRARELQNAG